MNKYLYIFILSMLTSAEAEAQQKTETDGDIPRLIVSITVDQLRSDYLETFMPYYGDNGLKKLLAEGRIYSHASYPFSNVDNSSAMACLSTGTTPYYNNIPATTWLSRATLRPVHAGQSDTSDYPGAENIMTSTFGDELKISTQGESKVIAMARDMDAAIMAAGHAADVAVWNDTDQKWVTSNYYQPKTPSWIESFNRQYSTVATVGKLYSNADITALALTCVSATALGADNFTDLLSVEYEIQPMEGRIETQSQYLDVDTEISRLITTIEDQVGKDKVLFILTSTGYYNDVIEEEKRYRIPTGTFYINRSAGLLNMYLSAIYGQGQYVVAYKDNELYLDHNLIEQKHIQMSDIMSRSREMLLLCDGVREVYTSLSLLSAVDKETRLIRNGFSMTASGDIIIEIAPGWKLLNEDTHQQRQWRANCILFPIIFYGHGITHEVVETPVTTDQIAPTICKSIHIRAPNACKCAPLD